MFSFSLAFAQSHNGAISLYTDENIGDCDAVSNMFDIVDINLYYVRGNGPDLGEAYEFRLMCTSTSITFNQPTWPPTMQGTLGSLETGISVTHNVCIGIGLDVTWLGTIPVFNVGDGDTFTVKVVEHPEAKCPGDIPCPGIYITECPDPKPRHKCLGGSFIFNGVCNPAADSRSWGAIKSLFKE